MDMKRDQPIRTVGRCIVCGDMVVEVVDVTPGQGLGMAARIVRRCGCGDFEPSQNASPDLAQRETPD